ncbi:RNA polymerase sigma factor [Psychromicrobium lacuslunae]|nr:sigma-70 family RNA polymerase sigma factor [Psychromicrobium lacuslunae]
MEPDRESQFVAMHQDCYSLIYAFVQRRINDPEASQELAADVFRIVWQKWQGEAPRLPWLYAVARNVIGNEYRSRERRRQLQSRLRAEAVAQSGSNEPESYVLEVLETLKNADREVLQLAYWEQLSLAEIGVVLQISPTTAKVRLHRAREAFRRAMPRTGLTTSTQQEA